MRSGRWAARSWRLTWCGSWRVRGAASCSSRSASSSSRGSTQPVAACRVGWEPIDASQDRAPLPGRLSSAVSGTFVGRAEEYERLMTAWKAVTAEAERRVMLLSGEPGIGKTTLSARFARDVYEQGATVVYGRCDEDLGVPYQPWIEAMTQLVAQAPEQVLVDHVTDCGGQLARLVPELAKRVPVEVPAAGDGDGERFVLFGCVTDLLGRLSGEEPVLVVLDDLHWADRASVQLLRHVVTAELPMRAGRAGHLPRLRDRCRSSGRGAARQAPPGRRGGTDCPPRPVGR